MRHLIFDTETTDLVENTLIPVHKQPRIIELFGVMLDDQKGWEPMEEFEQLINPGIAIAPKVTEITGIDDSMVVNAPSFRDVYPQVIEFFAGADVVVAHNLSYDLQVVNFEFRRIEQSMKWPRKRVCTVEGTEHMKGYRLNLNALHTELFGVGFEKAHRARNDVMATARCYVELVKRGEL